MIKYLCLAAGLVFASTETVKACSPIIPLAVTEQSYEQKLTPYLTKTHRNLVDNAEYIVVGTFKFSKREQAHRLKISKVMKQPSGKKPKKRTAVTFNHIEERDITYKREEAAANYLDILVRRHFPTLRSYGISGSRFDTSGSCGTLLELNPDAKYLIFANDAFKITSMFIVRDKTQTFRNTVKKMLQDPQDDFGISFTLKQTIEHGNQVKLLQTTSCAPNPSYKILRSSYRREEMQNLTAKPIMMFDRENFSYLRDLTEVEIEAARKIGQKNGLYTNVPSRAACQLKQRFLMLGQFIIPQGKNKDKSGQMIAERDGYFDLSETAFEYHMIPEQISFSQVVELLNNLDQ